MTSRHHGLLAALVLPVFLTACGGTPAEQASPSGSSPQGTSAAAPTATGASDADLAAGLLPADRFVPGGVPTEVDPAGFVSNDPRSFPADVEVAPAECATVLRPETVPARVAAAQDVEAPDGGAWSQLLRAPAAGSALEPSSMDELLTGCPAAAFTLANGTEFALTYSAIDADRLGDQIAVQVADIETRVGGVPAAPLSAYVASVVDGDRLMAVTWLSPMAQSDENVQLFLTRVSEAYDHQHAALG